MDYFIYISRSLVPTGSSAAAAIFLTARRNNAQAGITGYLHHEDGHFVQVCEGHRTSLVLLYHHLLTDPRHTGLRMLARGSAPGRRLSAWDMAASEKEALRFADWSGGAPLSKLVHRLSEEELFDFARAGLAAVRAGTPPAPGAVTALTAAPGPGDGGHRRRS
ncbi:Sensors of blue-light using FAD [Roseivivax marinus]|uniref:BLUF domain-containing protein n=1 Tax=Roseivivax marinus TaxID=1379903 RepID=UPI0008CEA3E9|nr:BLUF domain-containing protein [Roseivivax marinus]SEL64480.1 Sensors of blue-light using FAD [Roseivivax marinus]